MMTRKMYSKLGYEMEQEYYTVGFPLWITRAGAIFRYEQCSDERDWIVGVVADMRACRSKAVMIKKQGVMPCGTTTTRWAAYERVVA
jgi:hypothetical protein